LKNKGLTKALETNDATDTISYVPHTIEADLHQRFKHVVSLKNYDVNEVKAGREFVQACINFFVYSHHLYAHAKYGTTWQRTRGTLRVELQTGDGEKTT
jgi:hypothetical protein